MRICIQNRLNLILSILQSPFRMNIYIHVQVLGGERFDYVVVSTGHYSVPNVPTFQEHF